MTGLIQAISRLSASTNIETETLKTLAPARTKRRDKPSAGLGDSPVRFWLSGFPDSGFKEKRIGQLATGFWRAIDLLN